MTYELQFLASARREWNKLDSTIRTQLKKKLSERLEGPHVLSSKLSGFENHYKIKLKSSGYRLIYEVIDQKIIVLVVAIGKRNRNAVYRLVKKRR